MVKQELLWMYIDSAHLTRVVTLQSVSWMKAAAVSLDQKKMLFPLITKTQKHGKVGSRLEKYQRYLLSNKGQLSTGAKDAVHLKISVTLPFTF